MKVGDLVKFSGVPDGLRTRGIIVAELSGEGILNAGVCVLWASGELTERCSRRVLEVINA
ncbi:MAG TPA: hypothetical protein EYQ00_12145 [Dehalococcoidia bacterium]|nr:hypothetical protein [Dehalococcoidia bacterium]